ncbi:unnamed protein product [Mytilus edulis]|uniref:Uncharacterized protein n=1 Tax=Mytilus edulis TaxID=6550 RepID=A0A8S3Q0A9_MYTED|nr:unnamed protein product [Mytilus edulis]
MEGNNECSNVTSVLALEVTQEQRDAIYYFFAHNDWDFKEANYDQNNVNNSESNDHSENYHIEQDQESPECSYCLCRPCITDEQNRQMWWENENCAPHERNSFLRKDKFKRFWTNLFHRGVWNDPRYLRRKRDALKRDRPRRKYTYHRRDLIPKCVLELVRKWFPNPSCQEYMGHKWD